MPPPLDIGPSLRAAVEAIERDAYRGVSGGTDTLAQLAARRQRAAEQARKELKRQLGAALRQLANALGFELTIPGTHPGGIANQDLFDLLAARGWSWGANTRRLRDHVRLALLNEFEDADHVPLRIEIERVAADAIVEWVALRMDGRVTDVPRPALSAAYAKAKRRRYSRGVAGTASGALRDAVLAARVALT